MLNARGKARQRHNHPHGTVKTIFRASSRIFVDVSQAVDEREDAQQGPARADDDV